MNLKITTSHIKVFSAICSNLASAWFLAIFLISDLLTLTLNIVAGIVSVYLAVKAEEIIQNYD